MKHPRLSAIFLAVSAASLLMASTVSFAGHKHAQENFKGENFKAEVPPPCPPVMMLHDGFYIGAGVGYDSYRIHQSTFTEDFDTTVVPSVFLDSDSITLNHSATGWMGGIFVGYGRYFDAFYLGLELNANGSNADTTYTWVDDSGDSFNAKVQARGTYGIALLPGIKINDSTLLYARLGYIRTSFKGSATINVAPITVVGDPAASFPGVNVSGSNSKWRNAFQYGIGLESYVAENVSIRGEFDHSSYNSHNIATSFTFTSLDVPPTTSLTTNSTTKYKPSNNEFMLSLLYHFA